MTDIIILTLKIVSLVLTIVLKLQDLFAGSGKFPPKQ